MPTTAKRFVSRLTHNTLALVLAGGRGIGLGVLTDWRATPAVPFGGNFRMIDFTLSNCLNSAIRRICVLTQYKSHSLIQHLLWGWNRLSPEQGEFIDVVPAQQWLDEQTWYQGTADAIHQSLDIIESYRPKFLLILAGDHVCAMDYGELVAAHVNANADFTIACNPVPLEDATELGVVQVDAYNRIVDFREKPEQPKPLPDDPSMAFASMGIYVTSFAYLRDQLRRDAADPMSGHDFGKDVIPHILASGDLLQAYRFRSVTGGSPDYWRDVGTIDAYYDANLEIISSEPPIDLYDPAWPIITHQPQFPSARFIGHGKGCLAGNIMVGGGCAVHQSNLDRCVLFSGVHVGAGCDLQGVLALPGCEIGAGSRLNRVILDNECRIPAGTVIGEDSEADGQRFHITERGVVVVNREMLGQGSGYRPGFLMET